MSRNWIRYAQISISSGGSGIDCSKLRCKFEISQHIMQSPDQLRLTVYNMNDVTAKQVVDKQSQGGEVTLDLGYEDNHGTFFKGKILQAIYGRENPTDTFLWVLATGEWGYNYATVNKTLKAGSTQKDVFDVAMKALQEHGAKEGTITPDLSKVKYSQPVTLYGMARDVIRLLALSNDSTWWIDSTGDGGEVHMVEKDKSIEGGDVVLNSHSGLIGMPQQTFDGIIVRALINPSLRPGRTIVIDQKSIQMAHKQVALGGDALDPSGAMFPGINADGTYKIVKMDVTGDTRGNDWYCDMICLDPKNPGGGQYAPHLGPV